MISILKKKEENALINLIKYIIMLSVVLVPWLLYLLIISKLITKSSSISIPQRWNLIKSDIFTFKEWKISQKLLLRLLDFKAGPKRQKKLFNASATMYRPVFWHYNGILRNPLSGKEILGCQGMEIIERLNELDFDREGIDNIVGAYRSKKIFIYVNLTDRSQEVTQFRLSPVAPKRKVDPVVEFSHTVVLRLNHSNNASSKQSSGLNKCIPSATVIWHGGRSLIKSDIAITSTDNGGLEVISHMRGGRKRNKVNRWLSFASPQSERTGRSQEYYTMSHCSLIDQIPRKLPPSHVVKYKRIGESPPWFGIGHASSTELTGMRYARLQDVPIDALTLINRLRPGFLGLASPQTIRRVRREGGRYETVTSKPTFNWPNKDPYADFAPWYSNLLGLKRKS